MLNIRYHVTVLSFMHSIVPLNCVMYSNHIKFYTHDPRGIVLQSNMKDVVNQIFTFERNERQPCIGSVSTLYVV